MAIAKVVILLAALALSPIEAVRSLRSQRLEATASAVEPHKHEHAHGKWGKPGRFAADCGPVKRKMHHSHRKLSLAQNPGVGMDPDSITPFETVFKDDFAYVDCAKDELFFAGDKFGEGKFSYKVEDTYNVSIVHYVDMVPSEDQELMSQTVCFQFCRTVPGMSFFGLIYGRDCYCAPFFHIVAGDSSACTLPCKGDPTPATGMCGGKSKSALFEMHMCMATGDDLSKALSESTAFVGASENLTGPAMQLASDLNVAAEEAQGVFGSAGDPVAADLMQTSKVWAGEVEHAAEDLAGKTAELDELVKKGEGMEGEDFSKSDAVKEAEAVMEEMTEVSVSGAKLYEAAEEVYKLATRGKGGTDAAEYYPIMYFVDKEYEQVPTTCGGTWDGKTVFGVSISECAAACDDTKVKPDCSGFFYHKSMCLLFSKFKSVTYYTGCAEPELLQVPRRDEKHAHGVHVGRNVTTGCFAKLEDFVGTDLTPDPKGENKLALRDLTKADRCFE